LRLPRYRCLYAYQTLQLVVLFGSKYGRQKVTPGTDDDEDEIDKGTPFTVSNGGTALTFGDVDHITTTIQHACNNQQKNGGEHTETSAANAATFPGWHFPLITTMEVELQSR